ncbi:MSMEG_6728 family protein [Euzebya sp.]|uniref:MSMEG_6728 family protein n=1 Tax=Euzebya sp. TaxID=1971409 RepID=UPI003514BFB3
MQTFVPLPDFAGSAAVLDDRRLGKQRVEALQILRALHLDGYGWAAHPAVTMWQGHTPALVAYGMAVVEEWTGRGHADTTGPLIAEFVHPHRPGAQRDLAAAGALPPWWGRDDVHRSHRAALRRKDPARYATAFPDAPADLDYVWPDPPAPRPAPGPVAGWVVRGHAGPDRISLPAQPGEGQAALDGAGRTTKRLRGVRRLARALGPGDVVAVPETADVLRVGVLTGGYRRVVARHVRDVRWVTTLRRADLRAPATLQDSQAVFPLRDEPEVAAVGER